MTRSALALVNGQPWDIHAPLTEDCELQFLHFKDKDPSLSNEVNLRFLGVLLVHLLNKIEPSWFYFFFSNVSKIIKY